MKRLAIIAVVAVGMVQCASSQAVLPGWLTDPTAMKEAIGGKTGYQTPEALKFPYISTYYVKPTVTPDEAVKVGVYVTDFKHSKIRLLDDSHRFTAFLEYRPKGGRSKVLTLKGLRSGDAEFSLGRLPVGEYELRVWAVDAKGRESHRVIQDFRVVKASDLVIPADKVYKMTAADLAAYGIRNDGDLEKVVYVGSDGARRVVKEKRSGVPGYTVTVPLDPKTGKVPYRAYEKVSLDYDAGYDSAAVEADAVRTSAGLQKLINDKAAAGFRRLVLPAGTYRVSHTTPIFIPDRFTLDLGKATLKQNAFSGERSLMIRISSATDAHVTGGTLEGDYWAHDYKGSPKDSEWVSGFEIGGDSWYSSFDGVKIVDIAGYGGQNGIASDARGGLAFVYQYLPKFAAGGLDPKTGAVNAADEYRFTTDFKDLSTVFAEIAQKSGRRRLQICKYLGYQGVRTRSWQMTVCWYDAEKKFISSETAWQFREMWIPEKAAYLRVSVEEASVEAANKSELVITCFRLPVNCAVRNCTFDHCRCVGYAASAMRNMLFEGNFFTRSGEAEAKCAFDAEDGADQMQDTYFLRNKFRDNPINNSILTCAGHNFILEQNDGSIHFWGRTHSPCVRGNAIEQATYYCDNRIRSGYGRFAGNTYSKGLKLGLNDWKDRPDNWDEVLSNETFDGAKGDFAIEVGNAGRLVGCVLRDMKKVGIGNAQACVIDRCKGWMTSTRWVECTVKDSSFNGVYFTNTWKNCRFSGFKVDNIGKGTVIGRKCEFSDSVLAGFNNGLVAMKDCSFDASQLESGFYQDPASILFRNCRINTRDNASFVNVGVNCIGRFVFDGCEIAGRKSLVHVKEVRPHKADAETGTIVLKNLKWKNESGEVVTHRSIPREAYSQKKLVIDAKAGGLPSGVKPADEVFPTWEVR